jgi:hypothetical protein
MTIQEFQSIKIEVKNGTWVDITSDVKSNPNPKWNRGIMSNRPDDRVGYPGKLNFTLDNSENNLGHVKGYYSPGHTDCWPGWTSGLEVRLSFGFQNLTWYKYYGRITPDGLDVSPGTYGPWTVGVTCGDFMYRCNQHELRTLTFGTDKKIGDIVGAVNANMPIPPQLTEPAVLTSFGVETFPQIFDLVYLRTTAMAEYMKGVMGEWSYVYVVGDRLTGEKLVVEDQNTRINKVVSNVTVIDAESEMLSDETDDEWLLKEDGGGILIDQVQVSDFSGLAVEGMEVSFGKSQANRLNAYVYPRKVDATNVVLWELEEPFSIGEGATFTGLVAQYRDPTTMNAKVSALSTVTPLASSDGDYYASASSDGSGLDYTGNLIITTTAGTGEVSFDLENIGGATLWVYTLRIRGKGVYVYDPVISVRNDAASQAIHGVIPLSLDFKYLSDANKAVARAEYVLGKEALPRIVPERYPMWANMDAMRMMGFLQLEPGAYSTFTEAQSGLLKICFIQGYEAEIVEGKYVLWTPILKDDAGYYSNLFKWGVSQWDGTDVWA